MTEMKMRNPAAQGANGVSEVDLLGGKIYPEYGTSTVGTQASRITTYTVTPDLIVAEVAYE